MKKCICIGGWGHWVEVFQCLEKRSDVELCGIAPAYENEDLAGICGHELMKKVPRFGNIDELLAATDAELALVSTRPGHIAQAVIRAAEAGLHIISEKPLGITLEENRAVEAAVRGNGVRLMAILSMRAFPVFQTARRLYREGAIGKAVLANARKSYKYGDEKLRPEWFGRREEYGGTFPWVGIHALDMIQFVTGLHARQAAALQRNLVHVSRPDCEDSCCGILELEGGVPATVSVDYFRPANAGTHGDDWLRVVGTEGILEARENENSCTLLRDGMAPESISLDEPLSIFDSFIDGEEGLTGTDDALFLSRACLIARQAADEKKWMEIV